MQEAIPDPLTINDNLWVVLYILCNYMQTQSNLHSVALRHSFSSRWVSSVPLSFVGILGGHVNAETQHEVGFSLPCSH